MYGWSMLRENTLQTITSYFKGKIKTLYILADSNITHVVLELQPSVLLLFKVTGELNKWYLHPVSKVMMVISSKFGHLANHPQLQPQGYFNSSHPHTLPPISAFWLLYFMVFFNGDGAKIEALLVLLAMSPPAWPTGHIMPSSQGPFTICFSGPAAPNWPSLFFSCCWQDAPSLILCQAAAGRPDVLSKTGRAVLQIHNVSKMSEAF